MLKKHKNYLFNIIQQSGFEPKDFMADSAFDFFTVQFNNSPLKFVIKECSHSFNEFEFDYNEFKPDFPVLILNAGQGHEGDRESVEKFAESAGKLGIEYEILDYVEGVYKFDVRQDTSRSKEIIKQTIAFYQKELF